MNFLHSSTHLIIIYSCFFLVVVVVCFTNATEMTTSQKVKISSKNFTYPPTTILGIQVKLLFHSELMCIPSQDKGETERERARDEDRHLSLVGGNLSKQRK